MTQRDAPPPIAAGLDEEEEEEKTTVGSAPDPMPEAALPPRPDFGQRNTPTAFNPNAQGQSGPPRSQSIPRPPGMSSPPPHHHGGQGGVPGHEGRGSSGPQPLVSKPMGYGQQQPPPMGQPHMHPASGMMFGQAPVPQGPPSSQREVYGGGMAPSGAMQLHTPMGMTQHGQPYGADAMQFENRSSPISVTRSRAYTFVLDQHGQPIELGSGRFAKVFLGEERWLESKTDFRRPVVIKILQRGVGDEDRMRFQMEMDLLERVQGHPNVVQLHTSGEGEDVSFLPPSIRDNCDTEFMVLEKLDMSLEERLKGSRDRMVKEDLLSYDMRERLFRVLEYMIPVANAIEYAHLVRNICHRDIKPANILIQLPDPNLRGSSLQVRLADFNVAKLSDEEVNFGMTQMKAVVPGTLFFQSPEQETNVLELLVNVQQGLPEVEYFEDFYIQISKNDTFSLWNRSEQYPILYADRARKRLVLARPYREASEANVRARIQKSVGRPADIYSLGATFYYLISGAYANPKTLYDAFHKFIEYERADENNTIESYLRHEYNVSNSLRGGKQEGVEVAPADWFFTYKHYLDGNGELIDPNVMLIIAKCMIRNKPDSYCQAHDLETRGVSDLVTDLLNLYSLYGFSGAQRATQLLYRNPSRAAGQSKGFKAFWANLIAALSGKKKRTKR